MWCPMFSQNDKLRKSVWKTEFILNFNSILYGILDFFRERNRFKLRNSITFCAWWRTIKMKSSTKSWKKIEHRRTENIQQLLKCSTVSDSGYVMTMNEYCMRNDAAMNLYKSSFHSVVHRWGHSRSDHHSLYTGRIDYRTGWACQKQSRLPP